MLIPTFLGNIHRYRALQTGHALAWIAAPQFLIVWLIAVVVIYTNSRLILGVGLTITAVSCWLCAKIDPSWGGTSFVRTELALAIGFGCAYIGMVGAIVLEALEAGALKSPANVATFSGLMHFVRIFGGGVGVAILHHFLSVREKFHSNMLGVHIQTGGWLTWERLRMLSAGVFANSSGAGQSQARAVALLSQQVRAPAFTESIADGFVLMCWVVVGFLIAMLFMRPGVLGFKDLRKMS